MGRKRGIRGILRENLAEIRRTTAFLMTQTGNKERLNGRIEGVEFRNLERDDAMQILAINDLYRVACSALEVRAELIDHYEARRGANLWGSTRLRCYIEDPKGK